MRRTAAAVSASMASSSMTVKPLVLACAAALFAVGAHAQQPAPPAEKPPAATAQTEKEKEEAAKKKAAADRAAPKVEAFVVTGIRGSIEKAIQTKQDSDSIVEAITAEDIGKLPDSSIAESIARLPGLAAQRVNGRATEINIRMAANRFPPATTAASNSISIRPSSCHRCWCTRPRTPVFWARVFPAPSICRLSARSRSASARCR
jgi:outer membrane receptor protein involved in Fe transport